MNDNITTARKRLETILADIQYGDITRNNLETVLEELINELLELENLINEEDDED